MARSGCDKEIYIKYRVRNPKRRDHLGFLGKVGRYIERNVK
jgi:hypothetical protein